MPGAPARPEVGPGRAVGVRQGAVNGRSLRQGTDHAGDQCLAGRNDGGLVQVQPELIRRGQRGDDHLQPLQREGLGGQGRLGRAPSG